MVDVQVPQLLLPFATSDTFSDLRSASQYWPEPNRKRRDNTEAIYNSSDPKLYKSTSSSGEQKEKSRPSSRAGAASQANMSIGSYNGHYPSHHHGHLPISSIIDTSVQQTQSTSHHHNASYDRPTPTAASFVPDPSYESEKPVFLPAEEANGRGTANGIASYLQLPETITTSKGSLAEFAAQVSRSLVYTSYKPG